MHSTLVRLQNSFGFFTTVAFCTAILVALSVTFHPQSPSANIELRNVQVVKGRPHYYSTKKEEYAHIKFDLDADFSSVFNWNTKQVFVWIQATWPASPSSSPSTPPSQAVIWDTIINSHSQLHPISPERIYNFFTEAHPKKKPIKKKTSPKSKADDSKIGVIHLRNSKPKYQITNFDGQLASKGNVTLEVGWNVQPWVGALLWTQHKNFGRWSGIKGGRSKAFDFPALKGKAAAKEPVVASPGKPKPAEAKAVI